MKTWQQIGWVTAALVGFSILAGMGWATADYLGIRPVLISEFDEQGDRIEVVGRSVQWLELGNYERKLDRGGKLTRKECAAYRRLAVNLGVIPRAC